MLLLIPPSNSMAFNLITTCLPRHAIILTSHTFPPHSLPAPRGFIETQHHNHFIAIYKISPVGLESSSYCRTASRCNQRCMSM